MKLVQRLLAGSVLKLTRAACVFALLGLGLMSYSILDPRAIPVIMAMSVGHAFGVAAVACYALAVALDARRNASASASASATRSTPNDQPDTDAESALGTAQNLRGEAERDSTASQGSSTP
jgi:hypothetical protein